MSERSAVAPASLNGPTRWIQLGLGLVCMAAISNPQCIWTLFTQPLDTMLGVSSAALQMTFSLLIVLQTFVSPFRGWLALLWQFRGAF